MKVWGLVVPRSSSWIPTAVFAQTCSCASQIMECTQVFLFASTQMDLNIADGQQAGPARTSVSRLRVRTMSECMLASLSWSSILVSASSCSSDDNCATSLPVDDQTFAASVNLPLSTNSMHSIEWWHCRWPWVTPTHPKPPRSVHFQRPSYLSNGWN